MEDIYDAIGGQSALDVTVKRLYERVTADPLVASFFRESTLSASGACAFAHRTAPFSAVVDPLAGTLPDLGPLTAVVTGTHQLSVKSDRQYAANRHPSERTELGHAAAGGTAFLWFGR